MRLTSFLISESILHDDEKPISLLLYVYKEASLEVGLCDKLMDKISSILFLLKSPVIKVVYSHETGISSKTSVILYIDKVFVIVL